MQRRLFIEGIVDIHGQRFSFAQRDRRAQQIAVISPGGGVVRAKGRFPGLHHQLNLIARIGGE
ncbi:hypothetical protein D3C87_2005200 [compost metagenome]